MRMNAIECWKLNEISKQCISHQSSNLFKKSSNKYAASQLLRLNTPFPSRARRQVGIRHISLMDAFFGKDHPTLRCGGSDEQQQTSHHLREGPGLGRELSLDPSPTPKMRYVLQDSSGSSWCEGCWLCSMKGCSASLGCQLVLNI